MSIARKCNRCDVCFDPLSGKDEEFISFLNPCVETSQLVKDCRTNYMFPGYGPNSSIDLCPSCARRFRKFMACEDDQTLVNEKLTWYESEITRLRKENEKLKHERTYYYYECLKRLKFNTQYDAAKVLYAMREQIALYAEISVLTLYKIIEKLMISNIEIMGISCDDDEYGWTDLSEAEVLLHSDDTGRRQWCITFPPVKWLLADRIPENLKIGDSEEDEY